MKKILGIAAAAIMILLTASCSRGSEDARKACEAAENGDVEMALQYADKAYVDRSKLDTEDLCRLAASYAVVAITMGNEEAADRFQECYKASISEDKDRAEAFYKTLDPQMADGLAIISGLLDGADHYTTPAPDQAVQEAQSEQDALEQINAEGVALD